MSTEWKPTRWWRVTYADGRRYETGHPFEGRLQVWCETSDEEEARDALAHCPEGGVLHRLYEATIREWRSADDPLGIDVIPADGQVYKRVEPVPVWSVRCPDCLNAYSHPSFGEGHGRQESTAWLDQHRQHCKGRRTG